ncbi:hypothetical protein PYV50_08810 [Pseudomonas sp. H22_DOA]|nr:hypothetical protein PYV50_08810 [Pseudomonas sp. H22_DOA]
MAGFLARIGGLNMEKIIYFSPSTCGAYEPAFHGGDMPEDVVEVAESVWLGLLAELESQPKKCRRDLMASRF